MHRFLRSIGFSHINTRQDMDKLLGIIMNEPDQTKKIALSISEGNDPVHSF